MLLEMRIRAIYIVWAILLSLSPLAYACKCVAISDTKTPRELAAQALEGHDVVFEGIAESVRFRGLHSEAKPGILVPATTGGLRREFTFKVLRNYKAASAKELKIVTGLGAGDCGDYFEPDTRYVIFAGKLDHGELGTGICSGNFEVTGDNATLRFLRGEPAKPDDLQVQQETPDLNSSERLSRLQTKLCGSILTPMNVPIDSTSVYLCKDDKFGLRAVDNAEVSDNGTFCFDYVDPGKYLLMAIVTKDDEFQRFSYYPGVISKTDAKGIEIHEGDQITKLIFGFPESKLPSINGRVSFPGTSGPKEEVFVFLMGKMDVPFMPALAGQMGEDGMFHFSKIKPGHYDLLVTVGDDDEDENAYKWLTRKVAVDINEEDINGVQLELIPRTINDAQEGRSHF
jgi:hypothetical protein